MGVIIKEYVEDDCLLGIWEIKEDYNTLMSKINLSPDEIHKLESFKNHKRKLEWLSVRTLINVLTEKESKIIYNGNRKPFLADNSFNISISHSHNFTSILLSKTKRVGIDLEYMSHKISDVAHRFINKKEVITNNENLRKYHLYIHWCAKEAIYKICDKQNINFKTNIILNPFDIKDKGQLFARLDNNYIKDDFNLEYLRLNNYVIVWCIK